MDFTGAKAAFFCGTAVLTCLRDEKPGLRWPGLWDLPGGGREGQESAEGRVFPSMVEAARESVFFGGWLAPDEVAGIRFGDEGQGWEMMPVEGFLGHSGAVPEMQRRAGIVWAEMGARAWAGF
ncbi:MAG: 7 8-dihydro-8-oxoguanine triphosphatase [Rhodobacteraceae bacterium]|nr:MAG: 7 8-dihydro-8-oxoguanine triphosphatase [Paracoccaceae bacterium]